MSAAPVETPKTLTISDQQPLGLWRTILTGSTILLSAFLVFQVQPLSSKAILPWFGGSASVWLACLLFFQTALLLGYVYAHLLTRFGNVKRQALVHSGLLLLSIVALPITPNARWKPSGNIDPVLYIAELLFSTVGLPYIVLSATSPLLQSWVALKRGGAAPYRLFAISNLGSLLGLVTFPVLIEPYLSGNQQAWVWSGAYVVFIVLCLTVAWIYRDSGTAVPVVDEVVAQTSATPGARLLWVALPAAGSALLLAVSHHITQNIATMPLLWVIPLSVYLITFILAFAGPQWYPRRLVLPLLAVAVMGLAYMLYPFADESGVRLSYESNYQLSVVLFCSAFFVCCLALHGELARRKPGPSC